MRLVWTRHALADRDAIFEHLESDSPRAAVKVDDRIVAAVRRLLEFPESGRPGRVEGRASLSFAIRPSSPPMSSPPIGFEFCVFCTALKCGRTVSTPNKPNARLGRTPSLPCRPLYARYPAHSDRSANGRYPPNCDIACRGGRNGVTRIRIFLKQLQGWRRTGHEPIRGAKRCRASGGPGAGETPQRHLFRRRLQTVAREEQREALTCLSSARVG